jgi:hypothetical protein
MTLESIRVMQMVVTLHQLVVGYSSVFDASCSAADCIDVTEIVRLPIQKLMQLSKMLKTEVQEVTILNDPSVIQYVK